MSLANELTTDPLSLGYAALLPNSPGHVVDMLNAHRYTLPKSKYVNARAVLSAFGSAGAVTLDKLEAAAPSVPAVKWAMRFMVSDTGIDAGDPVTRGLLDSLVVGGVLSQVECDQLKSLANQPASRAEVLGLPTPVTEAHVRAALGL